MTFSSAQGLGVALTLVCVTFLFVLLRRGHLRAKYVMLWLPVGASMIVFSAVPGLLDSVSLAVGIAYPPALLFMLAIVLLILACMHFSWELSRIEERIRLLAETIAIRDMELQHEVDAVRSDAAGDRRDQPGTRIDGSGVAASDDDRREIPAR